MTEHTDTHARRSYRQILKTTLIMGLSSVMVSIMGIFRTKVIAMMLGPSGVGLTGIYVTITDLVRTVAGIGVRESGVRQIAKAAGTGDEALIARTLLAVRRAALVTGLAGLLLLALLSGTISRITFGTGEHSADLAILSVTVLFATVSAGQAALIQGMRKTDDLAKLGVIGAFFGTLFSIPIIYFFGIRGIAYSLIGVAAINIVTSWRYSRKIRLSAVRMSLRDSFTEAKPLLKLGFALMLGSLMIVGTQYLLRVLVVRQEGLDAAGIFQASTTLSAVYVGIILNAMMTDFYPRLSAVTHDHSECSSLINNQVEVGLLLAVPGILAIMTFAPLVITLFYSSKFMLAVDVLRWQITGVLLQVVSWPMGFMLRAKGDGKLFFWTEFCANGAYLLYAQLGMSWLGLPGLGIAFLAMNVTYWVLILVIITRYYDFVPSRATIRLTGTSVLLTAVVSATPFILPRYGHLFLNSLITMGVALFSIKELMVRSSSQNVPAIFLKIKTRFSF